MADSFLTYANYAVLALVLTSTAYLLFFKSGKNREAYENMDHLALNTRRPETEWLNMGSWEATTDFPTACENLTRRVQDAAEIPQGACILEVGHGTGDSLLILVKERSPKVLHGVTSLPCHARRAQDRLAKLLESKELNTSKESTEAKVWCGDALNWLKTTSSSTSSSHKEPLPKYDIIIACDCAYHFNTREEFFKQSFARLSPGGKLVLYDLFASFPYPASSSLPNFTPSPLPAPTSRPSILSSFKNSFILKLARVPSKNIMPIAEYYSQLQKIGFSKVQVQDITKDSFVGFSKFLQNLGLGEEKNWRGGGMMELFGLRSFGKVVEGWSKGGEDGRIRAGIVVATKA